jgi:hypothetical protein
MTLFVSIKADVYECFTCEIGDLRSGDPKCRDIDPNSCQFSEECPKNSGVCAVNFH